MKMRPFDFIAATREIELRNRIRAESGCLPSLNIALELEKLRELHQQRDFQSYIEQHRPLYQRTLRRAVFKFKKSHGGQKFTPVSTGCLGNGMKWNLVDGQENLYLGNFLDSGPNANRCRYCGSSRPTIRNRQGHKRTGYSTERTKPAYGSPF